MSEVADQVVKAEKTYWDHGWEKCKKQPLVPIGIVATCAALIGATGSLRSGNRVQFNKYLRLRVAAQGITVVAAVVGTLLMTEQTAQIKESGEQVPTSQPPVGKDPISAKNTIAVPVTNPESPVLASVPAGQFTDPKSAAAGPVDGDAPAPTSSQKKGKISIRALRESAAQAKEGETGPMKATDFTRRLGEAEKRQRELDEKK